MTKQVEFLRIVKLISKKFHSQSIHFFSFLLAGKTETVESYFLKTPAVTNSKKSIFCLCMQSLSRENQIRY